jgi:nucleotide-binding universal stress UspA family protein
MFGDVIVPVDGSLEASRALGPAATVARSLDSTLRAVAFTTPTDHVDVEDAVQSQVAEFTDVKTSVLVRDATASVPDELAALVEASPEAIVCMTTAGRGRAAGLTGSVATELLRMLSRPVLLIGPECDVSRFGLEGTMIVTVDPSERSDAVLPSAEAWATAFDYQPEIVTVIDPKTDEEMRAARQADPVGDLAIDSNMVRRIARQMEKTIKSPVSFETLHSAHTADEILRQARVREASTITMATHGETGVKRLIFGSVTANVVNNATCPVLVIRPPDLH